MWGVTYFYYYSFGTSWGHIISHYRAYLIKTKISSFISISLISLRFIFQSSKKNQNSNCLPCHIYYIGKERCVYLYSLSNIQSSNNSRIQHEPIQSLKKTNFIRECPVIIPNNLDTRFFEKLHEIRQGINKMKEHFRPILRKTFND